MSHLRAPVPGPPQPQATKDEAGVPQAEVRGAAGGEAGREQQHDGDTHHPPPVVQVFVTLTLSLLHFYWCPRPPLVTKSHDKWLQFQNFLYRTPSDNVPFSYFISQFYQVL